MKGFKYTHELFYFGKQLKCFVYRDVVKINNKVYVRTNDGRAFWIEESKISLITG